MNYIQTTQDTIRILRTTKLAWVFGFLSLLCLMIRPLLQFVRDNPLFVFIYIPASLVIMYFSTISAGGFIYVIHQNVLGQNFNFSDIWFHSKTKIFSIIGASFPALLLALFVSIILKYAFPNSSFQWLIEFIAGSFISSLFIFSTCAIMIDDVKAVSASWTGFLIALKNFFRVLIIAGTIYLMRIFLTGLAIAILRVFDYPPSQIIMGVPVTLIAVWIFYLILIIPSSVFLTLGYLKFTKEVSYSALSNKQTSA